MLDPLAQRLFILVSDASSLVPGCEGRYADLPGLRMHYVVAGPEDGTPVILLHGFPEFWYSWRFQIPALAEAGYRVIAPDQRGYNLSDKQGPYNASTLVRDIVHLQEALGFSSSHIVGHDWGGAIAWSFAAARPVRTRRLVAMNAPHINAYQDALKYPRQILKSYYIALFQMPRLPEWGLRRRDYALLERVFQSVSPERMTQRDVELYKEACARPGALEAMIGWYRAIKRPREAVLNIERPSCVIWGERDAFLEKGCNETLGRYVPDLSVHYLPRASHWVQMDLPEEVNQLMLDFLAG